MALAMPLGRLQRDGDNEVMSEDTPVATWDESASDVFMELGDSFVPWREDIRDSMLDLIPVTDGDAAEGHRRQPEDSIRHGGLTVVDLGTGDGWLSEAILEDRPEVQVVGLDGSPKMLNASRRRLARFGDRVKLRQFDLRDFSWIDALAGPVSAFVSCLVVHHLNGPQKRELYGRLLSRLDAGGALLFADVVDPATPKARAYYQRSYERDVRNHSLARTGSLEPYRRFLELEWNLFEFPDPVDTPSTVWEHLTWLTEAGFQGVEVFWARSGHALYGGYKADGA